MIAPSPAQALQAARHHVESQIQSYIHSIAELKNAQEALEQKLLASKRALNGLTWIGRLPPEILGKVFVHYSLDIYDSAPSAWMVRRDTSKDTTILLLVCRQWKDVALDCPEMWRHIPAELPPKQILDYITRSKGFPLRVYAHYSRCSGMRARSAIEIAKNFSRVQDLTLFAPHEDLRLMWEHIVPPTEVLERIAIQVVSVPPPASALYIPPLAAHQRSSVKRVQLGGVSIRWNNALLSSHVTSLELDGSLFFEAPDLGAASDFVDALQRMHSLRTLSLNGLSPLLHGRDPPRSPVFLPRLESLSITSPSLAAPISFLHYLSLPSSTHVYIRSDLEDTDDADLQLFLDALSPHIRGPDIEMLSVEHGRQEDAEDTVQDLTIRLRQTPDVVNLNLALAGTDLMSQLPQILTAISDACHHIRAVEAVAPAHSFIMETVLDRFPDLERLIVTVDAEPWTSLRLLSHISQNEDTPRFPRLSELTLAYRGCATMEIDTKLSQGLLEWLSKRRDQGRPIEKLSFWGYENNSVDEHLDKLRQVVAEIVVVDEYPRDPEDDD